MLYLSETAHLLKGTKMSDVKEDFAEVLKECEEYKDNVDAFIVLAVTNKINEDGKTAVGINAYSGERVKLCNLILNIDKELAKEAYLNYMARKLAKEVFKDENL